MAQKKDIKRQKDRLEALKKEVEEERLRARQAATERVLRNFERGQLRLGSSSMEKGVSEVGNGRGDERKFMLFSRALPLDLAMSLQFGGQNAKLLHQKISILRHCRQDICLSPPKPSKNLCSKQRK